MEKKFFFYKLYPPRPTFHLDMNEEEKTVMQQHMQYWAKLTDQRNAIVYGPVFDPTGVFGMAVIEVDSDEEANNISKQDPAVSSHVCTSELIPMQVGLIRK
jgi:uncharacterized protein YciI